VPSRIDRMQVAIEQRQRAGLGLGHRPILA
jgi:hypothetical protein